MNPTVTTYHFHSWLPFLVCRGCLTIFGCVNWKKTIVHFKFHKTDKKNNFAVTTGHTNHICHASTQGLLYMTNNLPYNIHTQHSFVTSRNFHTYIILMLGLPWTHSFTWTQSLKSTDHSNQQEMLYHDNQGFGKCLIQMATNIYIHTCLLALVWLLLPLVFGVSVLFLAFLGCIGHHKNKNKLESRIDS